MASRINDTEQLLRLVEKTANEINANKTDLLRKVKLYESVSNSHAQGGSLIRTKREAARNYTELALGLLSLVGTFQLSLTNMTRIVNIK